MAKRKKELIQVVSTLNFTQEDLNDAKEWWKRQNYSPEDDASILLQAALAGVVIVDIDDVYIL